MFTKDAKSNSDRLVKELNKNIFYRAQAILLTDLVNMVLYKSNALFSDNDVSSYVSEMMSTVRNIPMDNNDKYPFKIIWEKGMSEFVEIPTM